MLRTLLTFSFLFAFFIAVFAQKRAIGLQLGYSNTSISHVRKGADFDPMQGYAAALFGRFQMTKFAYIQLEGGYAARKLKGSIETIYDNPINPKFVRTYEQTQNLIELGMLLYAQFGAKRIRPYVGAGFNIGFNRNKITPFTNTPSPFVVKKKDEYVANDTNILFEGGARCRLSASADALFNVRYGIGFSTFRYYAFSLERFDSNVNYGRLQINLGAAKLF